MQKDINPKVLEYVRKSASRGKTREKILDDLSGLGFSGSDAQDICERAASAAQPASPWGKASFIKKILLSVKSGRGGIFNENMKRNEMAFSKNHIAWSMVSWCVRVPFLIPLTLWYGREHIRRFVFCLEKRYLFVRRGVFLYSYTFVLYENIQDIHVVQSFLDRMFGVCNVIVYTATTGAQASVMIPALDRQSAENLKSMIYSKVRGAKDVTD